MQSYLNNILQVVGDEWVKPETEAKSICSFDLFFLTKLAEYLDVDDITELGCGATTVELRRLGFNVTPFSLDISKAAQKAELKFDFVKCNVMDRKFLEQIVDNVKDSQLLIIDCLHSAEMAKYYSENILPHSNGLIWIHDYWNEKGYKPYAEQRYLDKHVVGKSHSIWTLTDLPINDLKMVSDQIGFDITKQKHTRPLTTNQGPKMCSVVLEKI